MTKRFVVALLVALLASPAGAAMGTIRLKDIGRLNGFRENHLIGFGVVTGLAGTGDSVRSRATRQSVSNILSNFGMVVPADQINSRNVAIVSVMASLPPITHRGDRADVVVTSLGDARSLVGGTLLMASLKGADGQIHALAQGPVSIGGYRYDQNGNVAQKNHPTVGTIPGGAQIETEQVASMVRSDGSLRFVLNIADHTTAQRVATAINGAFDRPIAVPSDSSSVRIVAPEAGSESVARFLARLESVKVVPDVKARVVVNERTGTIVSGGNVRISQVTVAHGDLKVSIVTDYAASQPQLLTRPGAGIRTVVVPNTRVDVEESAAALAEFKGQSSVADLVNSLRKMKANTRDIIAILQGIKTAGALHAELVIQ